MEAPLIINHYWQSERTLWSHAYLARKISITQERRQQIKNITESLNIENNKIYSKYLNQKWPYLPIANYNIDAPLNCISKAYNLQVMGNRCCFWELQTMWKMNFMQRRRQQISTKTFLPWLQP